MMRSVAIKELASILGNGSGSDNVAEVFYPKNLTASSSSLIADVNTDTRTLKTGDLFVALSGPNFDGHDFLELASESGAVAAVVDKKSFKNKQLAESSPLPLIIVADTLLALGQIAQWNRRLFTQPVLAITGSAGKTSVKTMASQVLGEFGECWATPGNLNNHIGAPLTLIALSEKYSAAVIELGASGLGEIAYTANFTQPDVAIITNVSGAHLEGFGSIENIASTKGEIIDALGSKGTAILNRDDAFYDQWCERAKPRDIISFGLTDQADVYAKNIRCHESGSVFEICTANEQQVAEISLLGKHNVVNALAVCAAALAMGMTLVQVVKRFASLQKVPGRLELLPGVNGLSVIDDSYNASPASVKAAIDVLALWKEKSCLVLGDMAELGDAFTTTHMEMGAYAKESGIQQLLATGKGCKSAVEAFAEGAQWFETRAQLIEFIKNNTAPDQVLLVKGSRSAGMDQVVKALALPASLGEEE